MADQQVAFTVKTIVNKGFIQRLVNINEAQQDMPPEERPEYQQKPLRAAVKFVKLEPGKKDFQLALEVISTKITRAIAANIMSGVVDVYPAEQQEDDSEDEQQLDIEDYVKEADE